jgi:hypothetical protein
MASFMLADGRPFRLRLGPTGLHRFGGRPAHRGITPPHTHTPLQLLLLLDLADAACPIKSDGAVRHLPLYYPLKYGQGGPSVQYAVLSEDEISILYISDAEPDPEDRQYVRVPELPTCAAAIIPLRYEEARILAFAGGYFQPNADDRAILDDLNREHPLVLLGGHARLPVNAGDVICRNLACRSFNRRVWVDVIASIPPVPINGVLPAGVQNLIRRCRAQGGTGSRLGPGAGARRGNALLRLTRAQAVAAAAG